MGLEVEEVEKHVELVDMIKQPIYHSKLVEIADEEAIILEKVV